VDQFTWPRLCRRLIARAAGELDRLADALLAANSQGQKVLAVAGCRRGEGATTLLLCAARRLAERGIKPVLVDADLVQPRLAKRLGVQPQFGWDETEEEGRSLDQAIVEATANNVALLPLREPSAEFDRSSGDLARLPACLNVLREHYDMVLVDLGPLEEPAPAEDAISRNARLVDAIVLVHNHRLTSAERLTACQEQLTEAGTAVAGIVENFVAED
jgi:Mrp family chromosome partitioning ATPase